MLKHNEQTVSAMFLLFTEDLSTDFLSGLPKAQLNRQGIPLLCDG